MSYAPLIGTSEADNQGWHYEQIKAAVRMQGTTFAALSRVHGYAPGTIGVAVRKAGISTHAEQIVAAFLGVAPQALWPDRYTRDGKSLTATHGPWKSRVRRAAKKRGAR